MEVYFLEHVLEIDDYKEIVKHIGLFSTFDRAKEAMETLRFLPGFKEYPLECFQINKIKVDEYEWKTGFISGDETMEE